MIRHAAAPVTARPLTTRRTSRDVAFGLPLGLGITLGYAADMAGHLPAGWSIGRAGTVEILAVSLAVGVGRYIAVQGDAVATTARPRGARIGEAQALGREGASLPAGDHWPGRGLAAAAATLVMRADSWIMDSLWQDDRSDTLSPWHALGVALGGGGAATLGGVLCLMPYLWPLPVVAATLLSMMVMILALAVFGSVMGRLTGTSAAHSAVRAAVAGSLLAVFVWALCVSVRVVGSLDI